MPLVDDGPRRYVFDIIWAPCHTRRRLDWLVEIGDEFEPEFDALDEDVRVEILALSRLLQKVGPQLGRPRVDTLKGSKANLLVAGDKSGQSQWRFYRDLIRKADERLDAHFARLMKKGT